MNCKCRAITELAGESANEYAREHLQKIAVNSVEWTIEYRCPETEVQFVMSYPNGGLHGGGPPRLSKICTH